MRRGTCLPPCLPHVKKRNDDPNGKKNEKPRKQIRRAAIVQELINAPKDHGKNQNVQEIREAKLAHLLREEGEKARKEILDIHVLFPTKSVCSSQYSHHQSPRYS